MSAMLFVPLAVFLVILPWILFALERWLLNRKRVEYAYAYAADEEVLTIGNPRLMRWKVLLLAGGIGAMILFGLWRHGLPATLGDYFDIVFPALIVWAVAASGIFCESRSWMLWGADVLTTGAPCSGTRHYPWSELESIWHGMTGPRLEFGRYGTVGVDERLEGADLLLEAAERHLEHNRAS
ncbi:MAG: hypothetical protein AAGE18_00665 [Pseudomonadota bacterium]